MYKSINYFFSLLLVISLMLACKPVRKSYVPYRKRNKCGCPTYGLHQHKKNKVIFASEKSNSKNLFQ